MSAAPTRAWVLRDGHCAFAPGSSRFYLPGGRPPCPPNVGCADEGVGALVSRRAAAPTDAWVLQSLRWAAPTKECGFRVPHGFAAPGPRNPPNVGYADKGVGSMVPVGWLRRQGAWIFQIS